MLINRSSAFVLYFLLAFSLNGFGQVTDDPAERMRLIVRDILEAGGYPTLEIRLRQDFNIRNAMAVRDGQFRYIKYNPTYIAEFEKSAQTQYATYALLAHEIGHHALGHSLSENDPARCKKNELEADGFAGRVLNMMCISLDEATAGFRSMDQDPNSLSCYPPPSVREAAVSNGWLERNAYFEGLGRHPCEEQKPFPLDMGKMEYNRSENVKAVIEGSRMKITYDLPRDVPSYRVFFAIKPNAPFTPKSLNWVGDSTKPGNGRMLIWDFGADGYTRAQVDNKTEWMDIAAYAPKYEPLPYSGSKRALHILGVVGGAGLLGWGVFEKFNVISMYDDYKNNRNPDASFWVNNELSRQETFDKANNKNKLALGGMVIGGAATFYFISRIIVWSKKHKRYNSAHFYAAAEPRLQLESLAFVTDFGPGIGLRARF